MQDEHDPRLFSWAEDAWKMAIPVTLFLVALVVFAQTGPEDELVVRAVKAAIIVFAYLCVICALLWAFQGFPIRKKTTLSGLTQTCLIAMGTAVCLVIICVAVLAALAL